MRPSATANDAISKKIADMLRSLLGPNLREVLLFGSRARGDADPSSDYDVLVVLDADTAEARKKIDQVSGRLLDEQGVLVSLIPVSEGHFLAERYEPLYIRVRQEGVRL